MNHNRSTALERSVKITGGLKPVSRVPNLVSVGTPPDEMTSSPLHLGKPVTPCHCLAFIQTTRTDAIVILPQTVTDRTGR